MTQEYARVSVEMPENKDKKSLHQELTYEIENPIYHQVLIMEKRSDTYQIASDIQWEYAGDGIVRQIMSYDENLMMVKVKFNQGAVGTLHQHPHTQSTYVASGCFEVTIGEEKKVLKAGDGYYVAPNLPHGCVCLEAGVLIDTFTPMRKDFLK